LRSAGNAPVIKLLVLCTALLAGFVARSQGYGNGWIDHSLTYFKFPLHKEGIHRIDSMVLGKRFDLSTVNPAHFCLFLKGKEQRLYVHGAADGKINTGDYIEFYAEPLTREIDSLLYQGIGYVPNPYGALFNDTVSPFSPSGTRRPTCAIPLKRTLTVPLTLPPPISIPTGSDPLRINTTGCLSSGAW
jgi:hypothetical protein